MTEISTLIVVPAILAAGMTAGWATVVLTRNGGWADVFWTLTVGVAAVWASLASQAGGRPRSIVVAILIGAWSLRLTLHLLQRVASSAEDFRYARLRHEWGPAFNRKMLGFLQLQAAFALPLVAAVHLAASRPGRFPDAADWLGIAILSIAVTGATIADRQLADFARSGKSKRQVLQHGLWGWSRHPNFFFEWLGWCAWPVIAIGVQLELWPGVLALLAPITMYYLLVFVTGIPPIEARMLASRGEAFRAYQSRVPVFFPRPPIRREGNQP